MHEHDWIGIAQTTIFTHGSAVDGGPSKEINNRHPISTRLLLLLPFRGLLHAVPHLVDTGHVLSVELASLVQCHRLIGA